MTRWVLFFIFATLYGPAFSQETDSLQDIIEQQRLLTAELDSGALRVSPEDEAVIRHEQSRVFALAKPDMQLNDLSVAKRVELDRSLHRINALVVGTSAADRGQRQCRSEKRTGSQMRKTICRTKQEWERIAQDARAYKGRYFVCVPPGCGENPQDSALRMQRPAANR